MIAEINVPLTVTMTWLYGALGAVLIVGAILGTFNQGKKLFGRRPPMDEQLAHLDKTIRRDMEKQIKQLRRDFTSKFDEMKHARTEHGAVIERSFERLGTKLDEQTADIKADGARRGEAIGEKFLEVFRELGELKERTKKL